MKPKNIALLLLLLAFGCKDAKSTKQTSADPEPVVKDISELSYIEIYEALFTDSNGGFDAHGDLYGQEAVSHLSIQERASSCGDALELSVQDTEKDITLAIKANFNFPGNPNTEMIRAYTIKPAEKISIGNSKLCYDGKEYVVQREIVSAGFAKESTVQAVN
ncbi:hypothetical protein WIW50_14935 [Flavobacteriaceae bacterium 3-367]|uniref:hypothetical protein n=1 Tax=Eudoraea algarum TaxID=3417568 RepID=UPI003280D88B